MQRFEVFLLFPFMEYCHWSVQVLFLILFPSIILFSDYVAGITGQYYPHLKEEETEVLRRQNL